MWSETTPTCCHWEQAFSPDGGKTWETNWIRDLKTSAIVGLPGRATQASSDRILHELACLGVFVRKRSSGLNQAVDRSLESSDVDTLHLHHRVEGTLGAGRIGIAEQGRKLARHDLP